MANTELIKDSNGFFNVININAVTDFGACGDGRTDDTQALKNALKKMGELGGGTVYLPAGKYICSDKLVVPENVMIMGEWQSPENNPIGAGTVILAQGEALLENNLFFLSCNSGLKGLSVLYHEQQLNDIKPYKACIAFEKSRYFTLEDVTIAGCYNGIDAGPEYNEIFYFKNLYLAPLNYGIYNSGTSDKSRMENVYIDIKYWYENSVYEVEAKDEDIIDYSRNNVIGMKFYYNDWSDQYNISIKNCKIGLGFYDIFFDGYSFPTNGQFIKTVLEDCDIGIYIQQTKIVGVSFTNTKISTSRSAKAGIYSDCDYYATCQFLNIDISGDFKYPIYASGNSKTHNSGALLFVDANIEGYNYDENYAFYMNGGALSFQRCTFKAPKRHGYVNAPIQGLTELGCSYSGERDVTFADLNEEKESLNFSKYIDLPGSCEDDFVYPERIPCVTYKAVCNVLDFGASENSDDNTLAFQEALDSLKETGGFAYIPGGNYKFKGSLVIPTGVELRGCFPLQHGVSDSSGTVLYLYGCKGDCDGTPFITLLENSGVCGFSIYYPEQNIDGKTIEYPWSVQAKGDSCWAVNVNLINSYYGIDFGTYPTVNGYIDFVSGSPLRKGIFLGNCDGDVWIKNCQFNPNYSHYMNENRGNEVYRLENCEAFIYGDIKNLHSLNCFVYQAAIANHFISQSKSGCSGQLLGLSVDGSLISVELDKSEELLFLNAQLTAMQDKGVVFDKKTDIYMSGSYDGVAQFFNSAAFGPMDYITRVENGKLVLMLVNLATGYGRASLLQSGGEVEMSSVTFHNNNIFLETDAKSLAINGCFAKVYRSELSIKNESKAMPKNEFFNWC